MIQIMVIRYLIIFVSGDIHFSHASYFESYSPVDRQHGYRAHSLVSVRGSCLDYMYPLQWPHMGLVCCMDGCMDFDQDLSGGILNKIQRRVPASCRSMAPSWCQIEASKRQHFPKRLMVLESKAWNLLPQVIATEHCDKKPVHLA